MCQVSLKSLVSFQRYAPHKLFIAKMKWRVNAVANMKKGSNSVNTVDVDMVLGLALCNSPHDPLSVYQVSLHYLQYF